MNNIDIERRLLLKKNKKLNLPTLIGLITLVIVCLATVVTIGILSYIHISKLVDKSDVKPSPPQPLTPKEKDIRNDDMVIPRLRDPYKDDGILPYPPHIPHVEPVPTPPILEVKSKPAPPEPLPPVVPKSVEAQTVQLMTKEDIVKKFVELANQKNIKILEGNFYKCWNEGCHTPKGDVVHQWKFEAVSEELDGKPSIDIEKEFEDILAYDSHNYHHGLYYSNIKEYKETFEIFKKNLKIVEEHNKNPDRLYNMKLNVFASFAKDSENISNRPTKPPVYKMTKTGTGILKKENQEIHKDWRDDGVVSAVIGQGSCGSCWAIAATDLFNMFMSIKYDKLFTMSYQQVIDCTSTNYTCKRGGNHGEALEYIKKRKMCYYNEYEYKMKKETCEQDKCSLESGINEIKRLKNEDPLEYLKTNGPFLTSFGTKVNFLLYGDGIFDGSCEDGRGHSVVVVGHGYDKEKKVNYWIVKNSWSDDWGEEGYFRMLDTSTMENGRKKYHCDFMEESYGIS